MSAAVDSTEPTQEHSSTLADIGLEIGYTEISSFIRFSREFEGVGPASIASA